GAALGFAMLVRSRRLRLPLALLTSAAIVAESWVSGMPVEAAPADLCPPPAERASALLVLPLGGTGNDLRAMYQGLAWSMPVVNGYSGHTPPHYQSLRYGLAERDHNMLAELSSRGNLYVLINDAEDSDGRWRSFVSEHPGAVPLSTCPGRHLYKIR